MLPKYAKHTLGSMSSTWTIGLTSAWRTCKNTNDGNDFDITDYSLRDGHYGYVCVRAVAASQDKHLQFALKAIRKFSDKYYPEGQPRLDMASYSLACYMKQMKALAANDRKESKNE